MKATHAATATEHADAATGATINGASINRVTFARLDENALAFFRRQGWAVLRRPLSDEPVAQMVQAWRDMTENLSADLDVDVARYLEVISQWRDLWKSDRRFMRLLHALAPLAADALELPGARLFHDQIICKTEGGSNGEVPWHQDSMYWPVERTGVSTWLAAQDTPVEHGCLEVADGSHRWGVAAPIDFMLDDGGLPQRDGVSTSKLPVKSGDIVLLHSGTWHRSAPTRKTGGARIAHIALWLPPSAVYWPENADWHPVNAQVTVGKGEVLNDDEFPLFGAPSPDAGATAENKNPTATRAGGMFDGVGKIEAQVQEMLDSNASLFALLGDRDARALLVARLRAQTRFGGDHIERVIEQLWINIAAFKKHRSRSVFCAAYLEWNELYAARAN